MNDTKIVIFDTKIVIYDFSHESQIDILSPNIGKIFLMDVSFKMFLSNQNIFIRTGYIRRALFGRKTAFEEIFRQKWIFLAKYSQVTIEFFSNPPIKL